MKLRAAPGGCILTPTMSDVYFYDGRIVAPGTPVIALDDRGYWFGDGVYDAWMVLEGRHFLRNDHLERLERSCAALGIEPCYGRAELEAFSDLLLAESGLQRAMVYFQWTRGRQLPRSHVAAPKLRPILSGFIKDFVDYPEEVYAKGCKVVFHPDERQHFCDIKTLNLLGSVMASNAAHAEGCQEAILVRDLGDRRVVTECAHSSCYAVKDGVIRTAPLGKLILPGITRKVVLGLARDLGIGVQEDYASPDFFLAADEVFLSAASGILPVARIGSVPIGSGERPVYAKLDTAYRKLIAANKA